MAQNYGIKIDLLKLKGSCVTTITSPKTGQKRRCFVLSIDDTD